MFGAPLAAQDDPSVTPAQDTAPQENSGADADTGEAPPATPRRQFDRIDLTVTRPTSDADPVLEEFCDDEAEAARVRGEIVVCRQLGEATDGSWNREEWERDYARRTAGGSTPDVAGEGIFRGPATVGGLCVIPPCPPEAAIMIDVEALPEAPEGSDADRIARGLPPLGQDGEPSPEEIAARRRAAGLDAPPIPEE